MNCSARRLEPVDFAAEFGLWLREHWLAVCDEADEYVEGLLEIAYEQDIRPSKCKGVPRVGGLGYLP